MRLLLVRSAALVAVAAAMLVATSALTSGSRVSAQDATVFTVTITNTTNPEMIITPGAYLVHSTAGEFWSGGANANVALERIAEIGDPGEAAGTLGAGELGPIPANGESISFMVTAGPGSLLSTAQMLIATNDAFVGLESLPLFANGEPVSGSFDLMAYDAGTEENADLFAGFAAGQPDPAEGMANLDNGTATTDAVGPSDQFTGAQAVAVIEAQAAPMAPASGSGGFLSEGGTNGGLIALAALLALAGTGLAWFGWRAVGARD